MDKQKSAWFFGWLVTRKGSDTSGNWQHKGRKGKRGGSMPGGGHNQLGAMEGLDYKISDITHPGQRARAIRELVKRQRGRRIEAKKPKASKLTTSMGKGTPAEFAVSNDQRGVEFYFGKEGGFVSYGATITSASDLWRIRNRDDISERSGVDSNLVEAAMGTWAATSNDKDMKALSMQEAASEEFGISLSSFQLKHLSEAKAELDYQMKQAGGNEGSVPFKYKPITSRENERAMLRAMYERTQDEFKRAGYKPGDTIRLFRGVGTTERPAEGEHVQLSQNTISSWSIGLETGGAFASRKGGYQGQIGVVLGMEVPIESILSTSRTGFGMASEGEFVVFGVPGNTATVERLYTGE